MLLNTGGPILWLNFTKSLREAATHNARAAQPQYRVKDTLPRDTWTTETTKQELTSFLERNKNKFLFKISVPRWDLQDNF